MNDPRRLPWDHNGHNYKEAINLLTRRKLPYRIERQGLIAVNFRALSPDQLIDMLIVEEDIMSLGGMSSRTPHGFNFIFQI